MCQWCDLWDMPGYYETLNPKCNAVTSEDNYLHVNRFAFQTNVTIQKEIYKHVHTYIHKHKNVCKTYTKHTQLQVYT